MGGDHKCPLCSATFTRPQHVGRHLRAHTGDRPYECRECPLRFARSDLLSRHVNKAHPKPTIDGQPAPPPKKPVKKGRRKSMPNIGGNGIAGDTEESGRDDQPGTSTSTGFATRPPTQQPRPRAAQQSHLTAQRMYPHHPLLPGNHSSSGHSTDGSIPTNQAYVPGVGYVPPYGGPMMGPVPGSEQGYAAMNAQQLAMAGFGYEFGYKKRACDQCNHSKVRCDFAEPCARCTHRSLGCTYSKPQRARTTAYPIAQPVNQPRAYQSPVSASFHPHTAHSSSQSSVSPQSHFASPLSSGSPHSGNAIVNSHSLAALGPAYDRRRNSIATLSPMYNDSRLQPAPILTSEPWSAGYSATSATIPGSEVWQPPMSAVSSHEMYTSPASAVPQDLQRSASLSRGPVNLYPTVSGAGGSSNSSPQHHLATTPALTNSTSPAGSDEPTDKSGVPQGGQTYAYTDTTLGPGKSLPYIEPSYNVQNYVPNANLDPADMSVIPMFPPYNQDIPPTPFNWNAGTIDPRYQFQQTFVSDDEEASGPASSSASTFGLDEATMAALNARRRSSVGGVWANAFNQMSLHDQENAVAAVVAAASDGNGVGNGGNLINDPFTISQIAQQASQRRPTFPIYGHNGLSTDLNPGDPSGSLTTSSDGRLSSLSDVKDIWKMFMTEPMTSTNLNNTGTPLLEKHDELETGGIPILTPRPGMGKRTLSKSNSLPDLTSPLVQGPAFFSSFLNGITPKPSDNSQTSYIPDQTGDNQENASGEVKQQPDGTGGNDDPILMKKWKNEIQHRVNNFNMRMGDNVGNKSGMTQSAGPNMLPPRWINPHTGRPLASVLQSSALQQTLAPERVPSFGMPVIQDYNYQQSPPLPQHAFRSPVKPVHGVPSSLARPGNKRLASQTLEPDLQKKGTFEMWDTEGDDTGTLGDAEDDFGLKDINKPRSDNSNLPMAPNSMTPTLATGGFETQPMFYQNWQPTQTTIP